MLVVQGVGFNNLSREMIRLKFLTGELTAEGGGMESGWSMTAICRVTGPSSTAR